MHRLCCFLLVSLASPLAVAQTDEPYDVLFIAVDDLNDWVGYLGGHPQTQTPNIDRLAARGMAFMNAQSPSAVCHAARTAILSGLQPSTTGIYANAPDWRGLEIFDDKPMLPRFFRENGYTTKGAGKIFHAHTYREDGLTGFNDPNGWDDFFPSIERQLPDEYGPYSIPANGSSFGRSFDWAPLVAADHALGDGQVTEWVAALLREPAGGPRFLAAGIYRPHLPWYVPQQYFDRFPLDEIVLPPHPAGDLDDLSATATRTVFNSSEAHQWVLETGKWEEGVQAYLASIAYADAMIGQLLDALDASGRADRTIVGRWGDHGFHLGEKERWRKFTLWKESLHVPFIIVAPGVTTPGTTAAAPVSLLDIYPTLAALAGLEAPAYLEGNNLVPLLEDPSLAWDHPTLSTHGYENHAVVSSTYKYIRYADGNEELYDVRSDPYEWNNLAGDAAYAATAAELAAFLPADPAPAGGGARGAGQRAGGAARGAGAGRGGNGDPAGNDD
jgi:arylsulfatase A-like enzyme